MFILEFLGLFPGSKPSAIAYMINQEFKEKKQTKKHESKNIYNS